jgi:hypothetical protein
LSAFDKPKTERSLITLGPAAEFQIGFESQLRPNWHLSRPQMLHVKTHFAESVNQLASLRFGPESSDTCAICRNPDWIWQMTRLLSAKESNDVTYRESVYRYYGMLVETYCAGCILVLSGARWMTLPFQI